LVNVPTTKVPSFVGTPEPPADPMIGAVPAYPVLMFNWPYVLNSDSMLFAARLAAANAWEDVT
jgi:hypothetical protein